MAQHISRREFLGSAGAILASLTVPLVSGPAAALAEETSDGKIVICHTNDVHCAFNSSKTNLGYAALKDYVSDQREKYGQDSVVLVDAGDNVQGNSNGSLTKGEGPAQIINSVGYDVMTLGNHEFDYGMEQLFQIRATEGDSVKLVCCNFKDARTDTRVFDAYLIKSFATNAGTKKVAFVGCVTPETPTSSMPTTFKDADGNRLYDFGELDDTGQALYDAVQTAVDDARAEGADYVVLLAHLGVSGSAQLWKSSTVIANTTGIDVLIDGHSHELYEQTCKNANGEDVLLCQTGTQFLSFGRVEIDPAAGTVTGVLQDTGSAEWPDNGGDASYRAQTSDARGELVTSWSGSDEAVAATVASVEADIAKTKNQVIGKSEVDLWSTEPTDASRRLVCYSETNLGDLTADAIYYVANMNGVNVDVAFTNGGNVRANIAAGDITYGNLIDVHCFNNQLCFIKVTGQHILNMLEVGVKKLPEKGGAFLQVSEGFSYTVRDDYASPMPGDTWPQEGVTGKRRVVSAKLNGEEIDPEKYYTVASCEFILTLGGSGMPIPDDADSSQLIGLDVDALIDYIRYGLNGVVGGDYANIYGQGRITILDHDPADDEPDTDPDPAPLTPDASGSTDGGNGATDGSGKSSGEGLPQTGDLDAGLVTAAAAAGAAVLAAGLAGE